MENEIVINGVTYVKKDSVINTETKFDYVIVRTYSAGVFAGYLKELNGKEGTVLKARRLWYWDGAASLSQLAVDGVSKPENCKFPCEVDFVKLTEIIEILPCTEKAKQSIASVEVWKA